MRINITKKGLVGIAAVAVLVGIGCMNQCNQKSVEVVSRPAITLNLDQRKTQMRNAAVSYLETFISDYVRDFSPHSDEMRENIRLYGGGEEGTREVVKGYVDLYSICLDSAIKSSSGKLNEKELNELGERLVFQHKKMVKKTDLSLEHPAVERGYGIWGKDKVERFARVITKNLDGNEKEYGAMVRKVYTREEFIAELEKQNEAEKVLFESFKKSLENRGIHIRLIGPMLIDSQQKKSRELNYRELDRFYKNEK